MGWCGHEGAGLGGVRWRPLAARRGPAMLLALRS